MRISSNAKSFIRRETKDLYPKADDIKNVFDKYDEIFCMLVRIIEYDIDNSDLEGLSERLPDVINRIVTGTLTRNDVLLLFPQVWNKFESYAKKLLLIIDPDCYVKMAKEKRTLPDFLDKLGVAHTKGAINHSPDYTRVFYRAKELRKTEAHVCELWSLNRHYTELAHSLLAYLLLTEHCLGRLKNAIVSKNIQSKLPLYSGRISITRPCFLSMLPVICDYPGISFNNIKSIIIKNEYGEKRLTFDEKGFDSSGEYAFSRGNEKREWHARYEWDSTNKYELTQKIHELVKFELCNDEGKWIPDGGIGRDFLRRYALNDEGEIIRFTEVGLIKNNEKPLREECIIYSPEGGVDIYQYEYAIADDKHIESTRLNEKRVWQRVCINQKGLITSIDKPYKNDFVHIKTFSYNENGDLERIDIRDKGHIEVETINHDVFFRFFDKNIIEDRIVKKLIFQETALKEVISYEEDPLPSDEKKTHILFEYYESADACHRITK